MTGHHRLAAALVFATAALLSWIPPQLRAQAVAQPAAVQTAPARYHSAIEEGRAVLDSLRIAAAIPGLSVAVGIGGNVVWAEGFGFGTGQQSTGVGLANIRDRLAQAYGTDHRFETQTNRSGGFGVVIEIPYQTETEVLK